MPIMAIPAAYWAVGALALAATVAWQKSGAADAAAKAIDDLVDSMTGADEEAQAQTEAPPLVDTCTGDCVPPECRDGSGRVKEALYRNKRRPTNTGGSHGYLNRLVEQMCGANGPGTKSWDDHQGPLRGEQRKIREGMDDLRRSDCNPQDLFSREERETINNILYKDGWTPDTIQFKGRNHPDCFNFGDKISSGRLRDFMNIIRP